MEMQMLEIMRSSSLEVMLYNNPVAYDTDFESRIASPP